MMRKALAVLLACGAILAAAAPAFAWPDSVEGQPSLTDSSATGYFLWHADDGFHLRTHGPGAEHLFTASLRTGGVFTSVDPIRLEPGDRADIVDGGHGLVLRFHTFDGIDGVDFRVDGGQRQRLRLALDLDGQLIATDAIHLGPDGTHPATNPFTLYRKPPPIPPPPRVCPPSPAAGRSGPAGNGHSGPGGTVEGAECQCPALLTAQRPSVQEGVASTCARGSDAGPASFSQLEDEMSTWSQVLECYGVLDDARVDGERVKRLLDAHGLRDVSVEHVVGAKGETDFVKVRIPGTQGRIGGGSVPTLGVVGRLGGVGARPSEIGFASDGDGALTALATACKLGDMVARGDRLPGDVIVATHVCPNAPTIPHEPVPFMDSPVDIAVMNQHEVDPAMTAVLSIDTTKGNRVLNHNGFAITPPVRQGWILKVSDDLMNVMQRVTGRLPVILPITMQDITPYGNGVTHLNSILQPATATSAPVVGVAITAEVAIAGNATGATDLARVEAATRFCVEVAKDFGRGRCRFTDDAEFERLVGLYGSMERLQSKTDGQRPDAPRGAEAARLIREPIQASGTEA